MSIDIACRGVRRKQRTRYARMHRTLIASVGLSLLACCPVWAQGGETRTEPVKTSYVRLDNRANAIIMEPVEPNPKSRIAILHTHPEVNNFNSFIGRELAIRGYRVLLLNYYGPEETFEEFLAPVAAAIDHLRSLPGVEKVVFATHSGGGPELAFYQDVAENGPKACQAPEKIYPCRGDLTGFPAADGLMLLDINIGAPHRMMSIDPAVDGRRPTDRNPVLDLFDMQNGFDPATRRATYSAEFQRRFYAAQGARNNQLIDRALGRLAKIENGEGDYKDDEPFVVPGMAKNALGARPNLSDARILSRTRAPHLLLEADGTNSTQIVPSVRAPAAMDMADLNTLRETTQNVTVRHFLSALAVRTTPDYAMTENAMQGIEWRSSANSAPGSVEGVTVPTLVVAATCAMHLIPLEVVFDHAAAEDKEFVAVEGANHGFQPCRPEYGDTRKRAFDYVDGWLTKSGRF